MELNLKSAIVQSFALLTRHYPRQVEKVPLKDPAYLDDWMQALERFEPDVVANAFSDHILDHDWWPTISQIRDRAQGLARLRRMNRQNDTSPALATPPIEAEQLLHPSSGFAFLLALLAYTEDPRQSPEERLSQRAEIASLFEPFSQNLSSERWELWQDRLLEWVHTSKMPHSKIASEDFPGSPTQRAYRLSRDARGRDWCFYPGWIPLEKREPSELRNPSLHKKP
ncbi:MAG: hypothetical protein ACO4AU_15645 [bacterium]